MKELKAEITISYFEGSGIPQVEIRGDLRKIRVVNIPRYLKSAVRKHINAVTPELRAVREERLKRMKEGGDLVIESNDEPVPEAPTPILASGDTVTSNAAPEETFQLEDEEEAKEQGDVANEENVEGRDTGTAEGPGSDEGTSESDEQSGAGRPTFRNRNQG